nr:hypothetical protein [Pandoravirus massiliensis]
MEAFALDPVDEMSARVRARWAAADRRRANASWWCVDTATVPRTPPHVLMSALAGEFDAYAAHRQLIKSAATESATCPNIAPAYHRPEQRLAPNGRSASTTTAAASERRRIWVAVVIGAAAIALLVALVGLALAPAVRARADERNAHGDYEKDINPIDIVADGDDNNGRAPVDR